MKRGQVVISVDRFGQVDKTKFFLAILRVEFVFLPFIKCVLIFEKISHDQNWIHEVHLDYQWAEKLKDNNKECKWEKKGNGKREIDIIVVVVVVCDMWTNME